MSLPSPRDDGPEPAALIAELLRCGPEEAIARVRAAIAEGELTDARLGDLLSEELAAGGNAARLIHLLGIIESFDCSQHILKARAALLAHPDARVRSKATLVAGRACRNAEWIQRRLLDGDPRVQANAVESVWGVNTDEIRRLLATAARSPHSRVALNALLGLYRLGDVSSIARLLAAAERDSEAFQMSARWAMGETGDPRFLPWLNSRFRTDSPKCRALVIRAMARIRRRLSEYEQAGRLRAEVLSAVVEETGTRRIELALPLNEQQERSPLTATDFVITENDCPVARYAVNARSNPDMLVTGFAIPRIPSLSDPYALAIEDGLRGCLELKRKSDLWCIDRYSCEDAHEPDESARMAAMASEDPLVVGHLRRNRGFLAAAEIIDKVISGPGPKEQASRDVLAGGCKAMEILSRAAGARQLFLCFHPDALPSGEAAEELERRASEEKIVLHGMLPEGSEDVASLARICQRSGGTFTHKPVELVADVMATIFGGLLNRYEITWEPPDARAADNNVRLQIFSRNGCADCTVHLETAAV